MGFKAGDETEGAEERQVEEEYLPDPGRPGGGGSGGKLEVAPLTAKVTAPLSEGRPVAGPGERTCGSARQAKLKLAERRGRV